MAAVARIDLRLAIPAAVGWGTVVVAGFVADVVGVWAIPVAWWGVALGAAATCIVARSRRPKIAGWGAILLLVAAVSGLLSTLFAVGVEVRAASPLRVAATRYVPVEVSVRVLRTPTELAAAGWDDRARVRLEGQAFAADGRPIAPVSVMLVLPREAVADVPTFGSVVTGSVRVSVDQAAERVGFWLRAADGSVRVDAPPGWVRWAEPLRAGLAATAKRLGGDAGALLPGLAIGDTNGMPDDLKRAMQTTSLTHLMAVSGANCAIISGCAFWLAACLRLRRGARILVAGAALAAFTILVTPEPSVVRAAAMGVVVLVALAGGRAGGGVPALAGATILLLAANPWYARDFGFALSVAATGGLLLLSRPVGALLARILPDRLAQLVALPVAAQLACQPILILLQPTIPTYGVPANLLAAATAPLTTGIGVLACFVLPALPAIGWALVQLAWAPATWIGFVARAFARLPGATVPWLAGGVGALLAAVVTGLLLWAAQGRRRGIAFSAGFGAFLILAIVFGTMAGPRVGATLTRPSGWAIALCDVGQGDAAIVRAGGATMLIDAGPEAARLQRCLAANGVSRVDVFVATHWDKDHVGGVAALRGRVDTVWHGPLDGRRSSVVLDALVPAGATAQEVHAGWSGAIKELSWRVLWPLPGIPPGNDASVTVEVSAAGFTGIFLGDLGREAQAALLRDGKVRPVDVVKVAHHGSANQEAALYRALSASVGLIGVGAENEYGHPTRKALDILQECGTTVVRTDRQGMALLSIDPQDGLRLWTERGG